MGDLLTPDEQAEFAERCRRFLERATVAGIPGTMGEAKAVPGGAGRGRSGRAHLCQGVRRCRADARARADLPRSGPGVPADGEQVRDQSRDVPAGAQRVRDRGAEATLPARQHRRPNVWCQMFSEPGAGSDVASLQTRAERDGDEWVLNGQKVWTTLAHESDYGVLIARTDPEQPKHAGISMFIVEMRAPGVEIRPIHQIDGGRHFNEVFFTDVRIPADWLIGEINNGWRQATAMLMYERVAIGSMGAGAISQPRYDRLVAVARANGAIANPVVRDRLMRLYAMETTKSLVAMRVRAELQSGRPPGAGGSLGKLAGSAIAWEFRATAMEIAGIASQAWAPDDAAGAELSFEVITSFSAGIAGGTDEIQRNIIGDRVLGLPRDIAVDTGVAFKDLKVGTQRS